MNSSWGRGNSGWLPQLLKFKGNASLTNATVMKNLSHSLGVDEPLPTWLPPRPAGDAALPACDEAVF